MNFLKTFLLPFLIILITSLVSPTAVLAAGACGGYIYYGYGGPCVVSQILVDKQVKDPKSGNFVDNLGPTDSKFNPEEEVTFKLIVKNPSNIDLSQVEVKDILPAYIDFVSLEGQEANWDKDSKTLTFQAGDLKAGESKEFELRAKVVTKDQLPVDQSLVCVTNLVEAKTQDIGDSDTAGACIQNVSILPPTGPEPFAMVAFLVVGAIGLYLIRKNRLS